MRYFPDPDKGLDIASVNRAVESAFADHGRGLVQMPPKMYVTLPEGDFRTMPAYLPSMSITGVKVVNVHPGNPVKGLPTVMALTTILDVATGLPVAILNATRLTNLRTGAAGAVAAKYLAPKKEVGVGLVGAGEQAKAQLNAIAVELRISGVKVWSRNPNHAEAFARANKSFQCRSASIEDVCDCDLLVTTTPSRSPIVKDEWIHPGTHINAIGADAPGKQELDPAILKHGTIYVDDPAQAIHSGEINIPVSRGIISGEDIEGTIGEVVIGKKWRHNPNEITIFDSTGLAIQDLAIAHIAMKQGTAIELAFPV